MREIFVFAFALAVFGASGQAGAFEVKDQIPDSLTWNGVTIFGTIDIGYAYQNHGAKFDSTFPQTLEYNIWGAKNASKQIWSFDASALERTGAGVKIEESLGGGWVAVGMLDTSFNPLSGNLANGPASLLRNSGVPLADQTANGDFEPRGPALQRPSLWRHKQSKLRNPNCRAPANAAIRPAFRVWPPGALLRLWSARLFGRLQRLGRQRGRPLG